MNRVLLPFFTAVLAVLLAPHLAWATTVNIVSGRDNTIFNIPATIDNSSGKGYDILTGNTGVASPLQPRNGLVWFDTSGIPNNATITSAIVKMQLSNASTMGPASVNVSLYRLTSTWGEGNSNSTGNRGRGMGTGMGVAAQAGDATWNYTFYNTTNWNTLGGGGDYVGTASATLSVAKPTDGYSDFYSWQSAALIADVQSWISGTNPNDGWLIHADTSAVNTERRFSSREAPALPADQTHALTSVVPVLTVVFETAVPEPATWSLLAIGGVGILIWTRNSRD